MAVQDKAKADAETPEDEILKELKEAQEALKEAEGKLVKHQASVKLEEELAKLLNDYKSEYSDLRRDQNALEDYERDEGQRLNEHLKPEDRSAITRVEKKALDEIAELEKRIEATSDFLDGSRKELIQNKARIEHHKAKLEVVKKPVASIRDRLKQADARKTEVEKAFDARDYARAYWLLTSEKKLAGLISGELRVLTVDELAEKIRRRSERYADAVADTAATEAKIKAGEARLKADQDRLAELTKSIDDRIAQAIADLPKTKAPIPETVE